MFDKQIDIPIGNVQIEGQLTIPKDAHSIVIFSHGSGSGRFSPRNNFVADHLNQHKMATLLLDLLTPAEDTVHEMRFDIQLLTQRLIGATHHVHRLPELKDFSFGYFGASTGAASALNAAALMLPFSIDAIVSRGGRPDLASPELLHKVKAPTLLLVGELDGVVIGMNRSAYNKMTCKRELVIVSGATHLFEEPGKLDEVAELATNWFKKYLVNKKEELLTA